MNKLTTEIKRILNALAYSHAGEFLSLRQKSDYLNKVTGTADTIQAMAPAPVQTVSEHRQIALYMGSELPADMMHYVVQTCGRLKNGLTVLTFQSDSVARALLSPYTDELEAAGISMNTVLLIGEPISGLARYLRRHPEVAFLACKETGYLGRSFLNGTQAQDVLPVPVVLVATHKEGVQRGTSTQPIQTSEAVRAA